MMDSTKIMSLDNLEALIEKIRLIYSINKWTRLCDIPEITELFEEQKVNNVS